MTIENLRIFSAQSLGGYPPNFDGSRAAFAALSLEKQVELNAAMLRYIRQNPGDFTPAQVAVADARLDTSGTVLDSSFNYVEFVETFGENAAAAAGQVGAIGTGVLNTAEAAGKILPFVAVAALIYIVYRTSKNATA